MRVFLSLGYGASYSRIDRKVYEYREGRIRDEEEKERFLRMRQRFYNFKNALKRDELVEEDRQGKLRISGRGRFRLKSLEKRQEENVPSAKYEVMSRNKTIIVIFDIPEEKRRKRAWLKATLKNLEFKMEQQSVWIGKTKISKRLLDDLDRFGLLDYVQIFEATKRGILAG